VFDNDQRIASNRRRFLQDGSLLLAGAGLTAATPATSFADDLQPKVRLGLVTDLHYADKPSAGSRHYRETLTKFAEAAAEFEKAKPDFVVSLGDLIDAADSARAEKDFLARIQKEFAALSAEKHYVLGNHCVSTLTKTEFLDGVGQKGSNYAFDLNDFHFVVLDACFRSDGQSYGRNNFEWTDANLPADQVDWLRNDLSETAHKTIVFVHQRLDVENNYGVKNSPQIRQLLEKSGNVLAVFQGHSHKNDLKTIGGIHYCTLAAMVEGAGVENNSYSLLDLYEDGTIRLAGFRKQADYEWKRS